MTDLARYQARPGPVRICPIQAVKRGWSGLQTGADALPAALPLAQTSGPFEEVSP